MLIVNIGRSGNLFRRAFALCNFSHAGEKPFYVIPSSGPASQRPHGLVFITEAPDLEQSGPPVWRSQYSAALLNQGLQRCRRRRVPLADSVADKLPKGNWFVQRRRLRSRVVMRANYSQCGFYDGVLYECAILEVILGRTFLKEGSPQTPLQELSK